MNTIGNRTGNGWGGWSRAGLMVAAVASLATVGVACSSASAGTDTAQSTTPDGGILGDGGLAGLGLNDSTILGALEAANQSEVQKSQIAQSKAQHPSITDLANLIVADNTASLGRLTQLSQATGIQPAPSGVSLSLQAQTTQYVALLNARTPAAFDQSFLDAQIVEHGDTLALISAVLPQVQNAQLRAEIQREQAIVQQHLLLAETAAAALGLGAPPDAGGLLLDAGFVIPDGGLFPDGGIHFDGGLHLDASN